ncbi:MAG: hypothetical protein R3F49_16725 [Planctomycetota bacterium]
MSLERNFHRYFGAIERAGGVDRCWLCRRTPAAVKAFFGFHEDGHPIDAERYGIEDIVLEPMDVMSYLGPRPVCAVCQLNMDAIGLADEGAVLAELLRLMRDQRDRLWPPDAPEHSSAPG